MSNNLIRIIGGKHRGRKVPILPNSNIRPTPDRVRETLFNWLMHDIQNARVLDLFTGSGAMSIEALSRGADFVLFNDANPKIIDHINQFIKSLSIEANKFSPSHSDTLKLLAKMPEEIKQKPFDIIILDPPFNQNLIEPCLDLIIKNNWLNLTLAHKRALIYIEAEKTFNLEILAKYKLNIEKQKYTGNVFYGLLALKI